MSRAALWMVAAALVVAARGIVMSQPAGAPSTRAAVFYVAANGDDRWSGTRAASNVARTDGPFATVERALAAARQAHAAGRAIKVVLRGGTHFLKAPLALRPEDTGLMVAGYGRERPVLSGGVRVTGWKRGEGGRWTAHLPAVQRAEWTFSQLWVNGQRRYRPRLPKNGYYFIADALPPSEKAKDQGFDRFRFEPG